MAIVRRDQASPWPFLAMTGMAVTFFLYAASGLVTPWWAAVGLMVVWLWLFVTACRWWTPHPTRTVWIPVAAVVVWFATLAVGAAWLGWNG